MLKILSAQAEGEHLAGHNFTLAMLASQTDFLLEKCKTESSTIMQILKWLRMCLGHADGCATTSCTIAAESPAAGGTVL